MTRLTKRRKLINDKLGNKSVYEPAETISLLKEVSTCKFDETLEMAIRLGIDARKGDQTVRGIIKLPGGSGKKVKIAVFADGEQAQAATEAGADKVGLEDLSELFEKGEASFDIVIATPAAMKIVGKLGKILGPRGIMPNPKDGTVTNEVAKAIEDARGGQARFRNDKQGIIHCAFGKLSMDQDKLLENFYTVIKEIKKLKPSSSKGVYFRSLTISSSMGPGLAINVNSL